MAEQQITLKKPRLPFTQVPNELLCSDKISGLAKSLWCVLFSKPENWTFYWSEIYKNFKEGREALMAARSALEKACYIKITQKRIPTGKGKETRYGGMDIELFTTPMLEPEDMSQTAGFPTSGFPTSGSQSTGYELSGNQPLDRNKSKQDLIKKYLSNFLSLPAEEKKDFLKKIWKEKNLKSDCEKYFLFRERQNWKGVVNLEADVAWWENGYLGKNPTAAVSTESDEIKKLRIEIKRLMPSESRYDMIFAGCPIEKTSNGWTIQAAEKDFDKAIPYEELLRQIKVKIEVKT